MAWKLSDPGRCLHRQCRVDLADYVAQKERQDQTKRSRISAGWISDCLFFHSVDQRRKPHLDYENRQNVNNGYCDMWKTEGYQTVRVDSEGHVFSFQEGMVFVFDQKKNMHTDYTSVGTH